MSHFSVRRMSDDERTDWDATVETVDHASAFHLHAWLKAAERETSFELHLLRCEIEGGQAVCLFPVFLRRKGGVRALHSPPPWCAIPYLGPVFIRRSEKQSRIESDNQQIASAFREYFTKRIHAHHSRFVLAPDIHDVRAFQWNGFSVRPVYTYRLGLNGDPMALYNEFDRRVRKRIDKAAGRNEIELFRDDMRYIDAFRNSMVSRYAGQGRSFRPSADYLKELIGNLPEGVLRFSGMHSEGRFISAVFFICFQNRWSAWIGGANPGPEYDGSVELLLWNAIRDACENRFTTYEEIGANTPFLCKNKSQFNLRPWPMFEVSATTPIGAGALFLYRMKQSLTGK